MLGELDLSKVPARRAGRASLGCNSLTLSRQARRCSMNHPGDKFGVAAPSTSAGRSWILAGGSGRFQVDPRRRHSPDGTRRVGSGLGPNAFNWPSRTAFVAVALDRVHAHSGHPGRSRRSGGQGVASSNLASLTKPIQSIRPSRTCIQPTFWPPSITPSDGRS